MAEYDPNQTDDAVTVNGGSSERDSMSLPVEALHLRDYFESAILPNLSPALTAVAKERPEHPIDYLAELLLRASPGYQRVKEKERLSGNSN